MEGVNFWKEVRRRKMDRVALGFGAVAFALFQVFRLIFRLLKAGGSAETVLLGILIGLFVVALTLAWHFERTPEGFRRIHAQGRGPEPQRTGKKLGRMAVGGVLVGCLAWLGAWMIG